MKIIRLVCLVAVLMNLSTRYTFAQKRVVIIGLDGFSADGFKTAFYYNWVELPNPMNKKYFDEISFEWKDKYDSNYQKAFDFIADNKHPPTLVFLYSVHTDHAGHNHNWMSPQYIAAIEQADTAIGIFLDKIRAEKLYDDTHFLLITDHGGHPKSRHGGTSMEEMQVPWGITGRGLKNPV